MWEFCEDKRYCKVYTVNCAPNGQNYFYCSYEDVVDIAKAGPWRFSPYRTLYVYKNHNRRILKLSEFLLGREPNQRVLYLKSFNNDSFKEQNFVRGNVSYVDAHHYRQITAVKDSKYYGVCKRGTGWRAQTKYKGVTWTSMYRDEQVAALAYDNKLLELDSDIDVKKLNYSILGNTSYCRIYYSTKLIFEHIEKRFELRPVMLTKLPYNVWASKGAMGMHVTIPSGRVQLSTSPTIKAAIKADILVYNYKVKSKLNVGIHYNPSKILEYIPNIKPNKVISESDIDNYRKYVESLIV